MPYSDPEKQRLAVQEAQKRYREKKRVELAEKSKEFRERKAAEAAKAAKEKALREELQKYSLRELLCLKESGLSSQIKKDAATAQNTHEEVKALMVNFDKKINTKTSNKSVFEFIDIIVNYYVKMTDSFGGDKQVLLDEAEKIKELIRTDQFIVFNLGKEDEKTKIEMLEYKKKHE